MAKTVMKITNFTVVKIRYFSSLSSGSGRARHGCGSSSASCGVGVGGGVGGGGVDGKQRGGTAHRVKLVFGLKRVWWCVKLQLNKGICRNKGWGVFWERTPQHCSRSVCGFRVIQTFRGQTADSRTVLKPRISRKVATRPAPLHRPPYTPAPNEKESVAAKGVGFATESRLLVLLYSWLSTQSELTDAATLCSTRFRSITSTHS